jgi:hypothetical protein
MEMEMKRERKRHKENEKQRDGERNSKSRCCKKKEREREREGERRREDEKEKEDVRKRSKRKRRREKGNERERDGERSQREDWKAYVKQIINFRLCKCPGKHFIFRFPPPDWPRGSSKFKMASHWLNGSLSARKAAPEKGGGSNSETRGFMGKGDASRGNICISGREIPYKRGV